MPKSVWDQVLQTAPDPRRAADCFQKLKTTSAASVLKAAGAEQARIIAAVLGGSEFLTETLLAHPDWLGRCLDAKLLRFPRQTPWLRREVEAALRPSLAKRDFTAALGALREFKQREMLRIGARDLARLAHVSEITLELSNVADVCLDGVERVCREQLTRRFGQPYHQDADGGWHPTEFAVIGLGKLGGQELNYSSDVDVVFVYADEGSVFREPPRKASTAGKGISSHRFFTRLAESFIAEVARLTPEGALYRIDLRLRPEGDAGPLVRSLAGYENFYAQWGQTWERMMLIKARGVAGDRGLAAEFIELVQPFRYPRSMNENTVREIAAMKQRIETETVKAGELDREVKRGPGGIREIEFVAQSLQLLHGGRVPFLQGAQTLPTLQTLARYKFLTTDEAEKLSAAYAFLRDVEHRLQMENNLQTHTIPTERRARERLAALMGAASLREFERALGDHRRFVRSVYDRILKGNDQGDEPKPDPAALPDFEKNEEQWEKLLAEHSFRDVKASARLLREFALGPGYVHVSKRTTDLARALIPGLLELCPKLNGERGARNAETAGAESTLLSDPDRVVVRLAAFIGAYGSRGALYETWTHNPNLFRLWLLLFDRSEFLAEIAIRTPDLVDDLQLSGRLKRSKGAGEILADLRHGLGDADQRLWLRRYHQAELMRIALREILGLTDFEQNVVELTHLARACLAYALEVTLRAHKLKKPPFAIIGLGKLGGTDLNYGSDLDILFVAAPGAKKLSDLQRLAAEILALLSERTEAGIVFATDARLRPDGEKGLLVSPLTACADYYRQRAALWEIQMLTRSSFVAGNAAVGEQFQKLAAEVTNFRRARPDIAAYRPHWRQEIRRMRMRIEAERTPVGRERLAFKTGAGGLIDAEFIAQVLCLAQGWQEPNTLRALELARARQVLPEADAATLIANCRQLRRVEGILRRWSIEGEAELPVDPAAQYRVAVRCGFRNVEQFLKAMDAWRAGVRRVFDLVFAP